MTETSIQNLCGQIECFQQELAAKSWVTGSAVRPADKSSAADLFDNYDNRPLVVGLFGGTGAGKSSLLNRLAGQDIARTGVVRPTSMEITAYLHKEKKITTLPEGFPKHNFAQITHSGDRFKEVMWVDMPDFDSEETQNRDQVLQWLPYIDVVIYVVTPERYRDAEGWRLLQSHGYRHGWLFAMNQWDKAEDIQLVDFRELLQKTGFPDPKIFKTSCAVDNLEGDDLDALISLVASLAERNVVQQLEQYGWLHRLDVATQQLQEHASMLAERDTDLLTSFEQQWNDVSTELTTGAMLPIQEYSARFVPTHRSAVKNALQTINGGKEEVVALSTVALVKEAPLLWGDWSATRLEDTISQFELSESVHGVPVSRMKADSEEQQLARAISQIGLNWEQLVSRAVANPGLQWQRSTHAVCCWLCWILPVAVCGWIAARVVNGFVDGAADRTAYVGLDFLVNGAMLAVLAWVIPQVATYFFKPSVPDSVQRTLASALKQDLEKFAVGYREKLSVLTQERRGLYVQAGDLMTRAGQMRQRFRLLQNTELDGLLLKRE